MADVVVLNLCTLALQTLDCRVLSGNNNHNKFILFQRHRRPEYIKCTVTLLYRYDYFVLFVFVALRPKSTAMVIAGRSVHLTTLFPGQA